MKVLATIFLSGLLTLTAYSQTLKAKEVAPKAKSVAAKPKPSGSTPKTPDTKKKPVDSKAKANDSKGTETASKKKTTLAKPKETGSKNNPAAPNPTTTAVKPPALPKKPDEGAEFEKAAAIADGAERIAALRKFIETFPKSKRTGEVSALIVTVEAQLGNDKLAAGDVAGAMEFYRAAVKDAPKPIPDQLFTDTLGKFPANLYFRGARAEALELAKAIEERSDTSVVQLANIATFYMSVENGSEARRVAVGAVRLDPASSVAYQTLGLASRIDFLLDESAAAYAKALELDPESLPARRGLAEMKRSLGKSDEAVTLYREILARDATDLPAQTGLILALFDAEKRPDAETELARSLEANPGNVILLAGAAYWYAAHGESDKAVDLSQKAIASDPRFIWSHIALARGLVGQKNPVAAEKTLLAARRYGNFPTLEYELASARLAAGFYREAAEELAKSFSVKDGVVHTNLGGRVPRDSKDFAELVGFERRASIFAPTAADSPQNAAIMTGLLELKQELDAAKPNPVTAAKAADDFVRGDDAMKIHRQIFAGAQLLEKKVALPKVVEITKAAPQNLDAGLDVADPTAAVMASELYESRQIAAARGEYISLPAVARPTLTSILRGRIEEIGGWALYQMDDPEQASVHLKRAVSVLPVDSAWWRSSTWRLGTALTVAGREGEAVEIYIRSYKSGPPDPLRYNVIEALYRRVKGNTMGLEQRIGPNPAPQVGETVSQRIEQTPERTPFVVPVSTPKIDAAPVAIAAVIKPEPTPTPESTPAAVPVEIPKDAEPITTPTPAESNLAVTALASPTPTPEEIKPSVDPESTPQPTPEAQKTPEDKLAVEAKSANAPKELFPPVIITIPPPSGRSTNNADAKPNPSPTPDPKAPEPEFSPTPVSEKKPVDVRPRIVEGVPEPEIKSCTLTVSEESLTLQAGGGDLAVIVGRTEDGDLDGLTAVSTSPRDVSVHREVIVGVKSRALFIVRSMRSTPGIFQVRFEMPCGKKEIVVRVR